MSLDNFQSIKVPQEAEGEIAAQNWMEDMGRKAEELAKSDDTLGRYSRYLAAPAAGEQNSRGTSNDFQLKMFEKARKNGITPEMWQERQSKARSEEARMSAFLGSLHGMTTPDMLSQLADIEKGLKALDSRFIQVRGDTQYGSPNIRVADIIPTYSQDWFLATSEADYDTYRQASELTRKRESVIDALQKARGLSGVKSSKDDWKELRAA